MHTSTPHPLTHTLTQMLLLMCTIKHSWTHRLTPLHQVHLELIHIHTHAHAHTGHTHISTHMHSYIPSWMLSHMLTHLHTHHLMHTHTQAFQVTFLVYGALSEESPAAKIKQVLQPLESVEARTLKGRQCLGLPSLLLLLLKG